MKTHGTRWEVWCGEARSTRYGLTKDGLVMSHGKLVSKAKHEHAMANKAAYVQKMNANRRAVRAPPPTRPNSPARVEALTMPSHTARRQMPARTRAQMLSDMSKRTW